MVLAFEFQQMLIRSDEQIRKFLEIKIQPIGHDSKSFQAESEECTKDNVLMNENDIVIGDSAVEITTICSEKLEKKTHKCPICCKIFSRPSHLQRHSIVHTRTKGQKTLQSHKENVVEIKIDLSDDMTKPMPEKTENLKCKLCQKAFTTCYSLERHVSLHKNGYQCKFCQKQFEVKAEMHHHITTDHKNDQKHSCDHCNKTFSHKSSLREHLRTHYPNEKPFLCPICGQAFNLSSSLRQHVQRHSGEKKFLCTYCPSKFVSKGALTSHLFSHTGEKPHVCTTCNKAFSKSYSLTKHIRTHTGERKLLTKFSFSILIL